MFWLILIAILTCIYIYITDREINTFEFISLCAITSTIICIIWIIAIFFPMANDTYFESGKIVKTIYHPYFVEKYQQAHTNCVTTGKTVACHTYYTAEYAKHHPYWSVIDSFGRDWNVSENYHNEIKENFGNKLTLTRPNKCTHGGTFYKGDPNLYSYYNTTNSYDYPVNRTRAWYNPIKNSDTIFRTKIKDSLEYPKSFDYEHTNRNLLSEGDITQVIWDSFNTKVFEKTGANLILAKVEHSKDCARLEDKWVGGKKNDLVICVCGNYEHPSHVKVFGWSDSALVKVKLEQYILQHGITHTNLDELLSIIVADYRPFDFKVFDYLTKKPPMYMIILAFIISLVVGRWFYGEFSTNNLRKY